MRFLSLIRLFGDRRGRKERSRKRFGRASTKSPKARSLRLSVEGLEERALLSTLPMPVVDSPVPTYPNQVNFLPGTSATGGTGRSGTAQPMTVINPIDPTKVVTVYLQDGLGNSSFQPVTVNGSYSRDGGKTWTGFALPGNVNNFTIAPPAPARPFAQTLDPSVAWDRNGNFYIVYSENTVGLSAGEIILHRYNFSGATPVRNLTTSIYTWVTDDAAVHPYLAVDSSLSVDPDTGIPNPNAGNVYVAWSTILKEPDGRTPYVDFNPNSIWMVVSSDQGATFSPPRYLNTNRNAGGPGLPSLSAPRITVSQGNVAAGSGFGTTAGQVSVVYDDFFSADSAGLDLIKLATMKNQATGLGFVDNLGPVSGAVLDADPGQNGAPDTPRETLFPVTVSGLAAGVNLTQINVSISMIHAALTDVELRLYTPGMNLNGPGLLLVLNQTNPDGSSNAPLGITGANLGIAPDGSALGTIFDPNTARVINDPGASAPFLGHFRDEFGQLNSLLGTNLGTLNGTWTLKIVDDKSETGTTAPTQYVVNWSLILGGGLTTTETTIASTHVRGNVSPQIAAYGLTTAANPALGVGPSPAIASDNTLGAFSVTKGNLYVAVVDKVPVPSSFPQDNTDIFLYRSTNGGVSWSFVGIVNNDYTGNDGFSQANNVATEVGRPQFLPNLAVDPGTGVLVATWYDARYDASRARVAQFVGVSFDAGRTFSQTYLNSPGVVINPVTQDINAPVAATAYDEITGKYVNLEPIPENFSGADSLVDNLLGFGENEGLAVMNGNIVATWTGNQNGGTGTTNPNGQQRDEIMFAHAVFAAGPRVIVKDDQNATFKDDNGNALTYMGPVTSNQVTDLATSTPISFNATTTADGTPVLDGFVVHFDRPIDPASFNTTAIAVFYRDVNTSGLVAGTPVAVNAVTPIFDNTSPLTLAQQQQFGASAFLIQIDPQSGVGTYSYQIASTVHDRIRQQISLASPLIPGNQMDQNANGVAGEGSVLGPGVVPFDYFAAPSPTSAATWNGSYFSPSYTSNTLPIIIPGPHVVKTAIAGQPATVDNLILNGTTSSVDVIFDRDMDPTTFTPSSVLRVLGPAGAIGPNGVIPASFSITPNPNGTDPDPAHPRTFRINFLNAAGTAPLTLKLSGTYVVSLASSIKDENGNALDTNLNAGVDMLRDTPSAGVTNVTYSSTNVPLPVGNLATTGKTTSTLKVTDTFLAQGVTVSMNITYPRDPDLTVTLISPNGTRITLVSGSGNGGNQSNFINTVFDDNASTPIGNGGPPFTGRFNPKQPLSDLFSGGPFSVAGTWSLEIAWGNSGKTGSLNSWSLQVLKPIPLSGLGETVSDQTSASFRIFTMDPTNPLSQNTWVSVGPASNFNLATQNRNSGPVRAIAVDPSDLSGNTVYVGGETGAVWKTSNFLTNDPQGPTYIPLTDFGPTFGTNIGSIAVFGRNNDPRQSIVVVATGQPDVTPNAGSVYGVGFLLSFDGGATWTLLDSSTNVDANGNVLAMNSPVRDHIFVGTSISKVVVDPRPSPTGKVIMYAAVSDPAGINGGIWRSLDSGGHWTNVIAGQATDVILDPNSGHVNAISNPTGNLEVVYAAIEGSGVFLSPNRGQVWNKMLGQGGNPQVQDGDFLPATPVPVTRPASDPNTLPNGRIIMAKPALTGVFLPDGTYTGNARQDVQYAGWLFVAVADPNNALAGLYMTKNFGLSWTRVRLPDDFNGTLNNIVNDLLIPSNDSSLQDQDPSKTSAIETGRTNYDLTLAVNANNPNIVYLGGVINLRIDLTGIHDAGAFFMSNGNNDGGRVRVSTAGPVQLKGWNGYHGPFNPVFGPGQMINLFRNPADVFNSNTSWFESNIGAVTNDGIGAKWTIFDAGTNAGTPFTVGTDGLDSYLQVMTMLDPLTGETRLLMGKSNGIYSAVDGGSTPLNGGGIVEAGIGSSLSPTVSRNGNLDVYEMIYGASQPSDIAALAANALFYGSGYKSGLPQSDPNILTNGNLLWTGNPADNQPFRSLSGSGTGVATDQTNTLFDGSTGSTVYRYIWPWEGAGGSATNPIIPSATDFFTGASDSGADTSHTFGLIQVSGGGLTPDPQWPYQTGFNFAVNPIDGDQLIITSAAGRVFSTADRGTTWQVIGDPQFLDGSPALALAFGAPIPTDPTGNLNNFLYVGTTSGRIFVTSTGGGALGNQWFNISAGLDGSTIQSIVTNPNRGSHEAYAVTSKGVYFLADSLPSASNPTPTWVNITGNLFSLQHTIFGPFAATGTTLTQTKLQSPIAGTGLTALVADWRYAIPNNPAELNNPGTPPGPTHPALYAAGAAGVYRSMDMGQTWTSFPDVAHDSSPIDGGYLPNTIVTDLDTALGNIDPTTGRPIMIDPTSGTPAPDVLMASSFGRGMFAIRLSPTIVNGSLQLDPKLPAPAGSQIGSNSSPVSNSLQPVFDGMSELSAFSNTVTVRMYDLSDPTNPILIGISPTNAAQSFVTTDETGRFKIQLQAGYFQGDGSSDGKKIFGFQATDAAGAIGPMVSFTFTFNTTPTISSGTVKFAAGSDSGRSSTDKITNVIQPTIQGTVSQAVPVTVQVYDFTNPSSPVLIGQGVTDASGFFSIQIQAGVYKADGSTDGNKTWNIVAVHIPVNSAPITFTWTLDTVAPTTPPAPALTQASDSGLTNSDHITNVTVPTFTGSGEANAQVLLFANNVQVGSAFVNSVGSYSVTTSSVLSAGNYNMTAQLVDAAGNTSPVSSAMQPQLSIQTTKPAVPTIKLNSGYDTGVVGDNITAAVPALFNGTAATGTTVIIKDNGNQAAAFLQTTGTAFQQFLPLTNGVHTLVVQSTDVAGNVSVSAPLVVTIDSNALDAGSKFIRALFLQAYGRPGTVGEWAVYLPMLKTTAGRTNVVNLIERSVEARQFTVKGWYQTYLGRTSAPANAEIQGWVNLFTQFGQTEELVLSQILATAAYYNRTPTIIGAFVGTKASNTTFLQALYLQLLGRSATANELKTVLPLVTTLGRQQLAYIFLTSVGYRTIQVTNYYGPAIFQRTQPPTAQELNAWVFSKLDLTSIRVTFLATGSYYFQITGLNPPA